MTTYTKMKLVYGIGFNDANYVTRQMVNGKTVWCKFYQVWTSMLKRCYDKKLQHRQQAYIGCSVSPEWHSFMAFKAWMETQDWEGNQLDKDLLFTGNKIYSPGTCVFVSGQLNSFVTDNSAARGEWPIGASYCKRASKFHAQCRNPFTRKNENLGYFDSPQEAHEAWRKRKHEHACQFADQQANPLLAKALKARHTKEQLNNDTTQAK